MVVSSLKLVANNHILVVSNHMGALYCSDKSVSVMFNSLNAIHIIF